MWVSKSTECEKSTECDMLMCEFRGLLSVTHPRVGCNVCTCMLSVTHPRVGCNVCTCMLSVTHPRVGCNVCTCMLSVTHPRVGCNVCTCMLSVTHPRVGCNVCTCMLSVTHPRVGCNVCTCMLSVTHPRVGCNVCTCMLSVTQCMYGECDTFTIFDFQGLLTMMTFGMSLFGLKVGLCSNTLLVRWKQVKIVIMYQCLSQAAILRHCRVFYWNVTHKKRPHHQVAKIYKLSRV